MPNAQTVVVLASNIESEVRVAEGAAAIVENADPDCDFVVDGISGLVKVHG